MADHVDVLIVGAGLSGIAAAHYLADRCPQKTYAIVEARGSLGGTWDLFRYPGIRSDSDMYTLGFSFFPWKDPQAIADGDAILTYLHETAQHFGIDQQIRYHRRVDRAEWSSETATWTVSIVDPRDNSEFELTCNFMWSCAGYYSYESGHTPHFEGREDFEGVVVHPQQWPEALDYRDKRVIVIGSGATAVTLVPELAGMAAHVTMLQRSPTYIISRPQVDKVAELMRTLLGRRVSFRLARWKNVFLTTLFYVLSRRYPELSRRWLLGMVRDLVGEEATEKHFTPEYDPWDQRICLVPDADLFRAVRDGAADVVTAHIDRFTPNGIMLDSGDELPADIIVTATGLRLQAAGGCELVVDGTPVTMGDTVMYKGAMLGGVPNAAVSLGYTNASWTLKCELIAGFVCRLLNHMDDNGLRECRPACPENLERVPLIDFNSGYVERALPDLPSQGSKLPWRLYQNYVLDQYLFGYTRLEDGAMKFR